MKYDLVYINGDSFSAGDGLYLKKTLDPRGDQKFFHEYSKIYSKRDFIQKNLDIEFINSRKNEYIHRIKNLKSYDDREKALSFSGKIKDRSGIEVINSSVRGSGLGEIAFSTIIDLEKLKRTYSVEKVFVFIMLTSVVRQIIPRTPNVSYLHRDYSTILPNFKWGSKNDLLMHDIIFSTASDTYLALNAFLSISGLLKYLEDNKFKYCLLDSDLYSTGLELLDKTDLKKDIFPKPDWNIFKDFTWDDKVFLGCGHFSEEMHDIIAQKLIKEYLQ